MDCSRHPVSTRMPHAFLTIIDARVNTTVQSASHSGPTPIKVCRNTGMICPVSGNPEGSFCRFNSPVPVEFCDWPIAVPTVNFEAERSMLTMVVSVE